MRKRMMLVVCCMISMFSATSSVHAASISFIAPANTILIGTPFQIEVHLETENDVLNAVDGIVTIPPGIRITNVETGDSPIRIWPVTPTYKPSNKQIVFTGGVPSGLPTHTDALLFKITAIATENGAYQFVSDPVQAYINDGVGTGILLAENAVTVQASATVQSNSQISVATTPSPDFIPPVFTYVEIGKDIALFNSNYFAVFYATDAESGIDHYEAKEGLFGSYVRANQYYVLQDQTLSTPLIVRAVDKAGNITTRVVPAEHSSVTIIAWVLALLGVAGGILILTLLRKWRTRGA